LSQRVRQIVDSGDLEALEHLVAEDQRSIRHLMRMTHQVDERIRATANRGMGFAARHHPEQMERIIRWLIWSMAEESGANGLFSPQVLEAIARERADLVLPVVPDMVRLAGDDNLHDGLADALCVVVHSHPGKIGDIMSGRLRRRIERGNCCDDEE
jgi:hypothetical protein